MTGIMPMQYTPILLSCPRVLAEGRYRGFPYCITSTGTHPCAYVGIPKGHPLYGKHYDRKEMDRISAIAHGGLTYSERNIPLKGFWNIGWDYAHYGDCCAGISEGRKWTTEEILLNVHEVIDSLIGEAIICKYVSFPGNFIQR